MIPICLYVLVIVTITQYPLVSTNSCSNETCYTGWTVKNRGGPDGAGYTMISPDKQITCDGVIKQWRYQAKTSNPLRAVVWRPVIGSSTQFKIVGITDIPAGPINQEVIFNIPEDQRVQVRAGDVIGWSFGDGVLAYNGGGGFSVRWLHGFLQSTLTVDQIHNFNGGNGDREYSIMAVIDPVNGDNRLIGWPIRARGGPDAAGYTMVSTDNTFTCNGVVTEWHYQAKSHQPFRAIIFRRVTGASPLHFKIVGINDIPAGPTNQKFIFEVPRNNRVKVQTGDMIGWSCDLGVLDYNSEGNTRVRWVHGNLHASLGKDQLINTDGSGNRRYAIAAMMKVSEGCIGEIITTTNNDQRQGNSPRGNLQTQRSDALNVLIQGPPGRDGRDGEAGSPGPQGLPGSPGQAAPVTGTRSTVYTRWGRTECPSSAALVYAGIAGGKYYSHTGSGSNYLCLPETPEYNSYEVGEQDPRASVFSAEYQTTPGSPFATKSEHDVPCAVCEVTNRGILEIPARMSCPTGWTREYHGYLMAERWNHLSSEFVCVDSDVEVVPGSAANENGALFYLVEGRCNVGNLPCSPYINGAELTCVVCSK